MRRRFALLLLIIVAASLAALVACGPLTAGRQEIPAPTDTATTRFTSTPTHTPSPTPTPSPTAPPAAISGEVRSLSLSEPVRQSGAPCGFVDTLDFPLDPPDAEQARGGGDFGRFRDRYDAYHAGEDWRVGSSSFGEPVYSIGHGLVVYAQPLGWGADKGVVIIQHDTREHGRMLSFYGHLDPPSVSLRAGQCVERGDQVGAVGDPRTRPHLHFEVRLHLPDTPGPGYWPVDPRLAGWRAPSATIWIERMAALPGVAWTWLANEGTSQVLGTWGERVLLIAEQQLLALDVVDGTRRWSSNLPEHAEGLLLDASNELIYAESNAGVLEAFRLEQIAGRRFDDSIRPVWQLDLDDAGRHQLAPLPGGGVIASSRTGTLAVSSGGELLWSLPLTTGVIDWAHSGDSLVLLARDSLWVVDRSDGAQWSRVTGGERVVASAQPYLYADDGVYRLDMLSRSVEPFFSLPAGFARLGDLAELPGGGVAVVHRDLDDTRLLTIEANGTLRWERSIRALNTETARLVSVAGQLLLVAEHGRGSSNYLDLYRIDLQDGALLQVFSSGTRAEVTAAPRPLVVGERVWLSIPAVGVAAWDPAMAIDAASEQ